MGLFAAKATKYHDGCCALRIRDDLATVVEAAVRNLVVKGRPDCNANQPGFPREVMAKDFRQKSVQLAIALAWPDGGPVRYPLTSESPLEVQGAVDWLVNVAHQQMEFWGWGWPTDSEQERRCPLVYSISERDLEKLRRCLGFLDEALARHPTPAGPDEKAKKQAGQDGGRTGKHWFDEWKECVQILEARKDASKGRDTDPNARGKSRFVEVRLLDQSTGTLDLSKATAWEGREQYDIGYDTNYRVNLHRTPKGRWVLGTIYQGRGMLAFADDWPEDEWVEVTIENATQWFLKDWIGAQGEDNELLPPEIEEQLARIDIDGPVKSPTIAALAEDTGKANEQAKRRNDKAKTIVTAIIFDRVKHGGNLAHRDIAREAGCSASYVAKIMKDLKLGDSQATRGWKDFDGSIEASA